MSPIVLRTVGPTIIGGWKLWEGTRVVIEAGEGISLVKHLPFDVAPFLAGLASGQLIPTGERASEAVARLTAMMPGPGATPSRWRRRRPVRRSG